MSNIPISARAWVHVVIDTTNDGTDEHERLTRLPSAKRTILFPFGQIMWSTWNLIRWITGDWIWYLHAIFVSSALKYMKTRYTYLCSNFFPCEILCFERHYIYFCIWVSHITNDATIFHLIHMISCNNRFITSCSNHDIHRLNNLRKLYHLKKCKFISNLAGRNILSIVSNTFHSQVAICNSLP